MEVGEELDDDAEYIEIEDPKSEPLEYISENENTPKDDSFMHMLDDRKGSFPNLNTILPPDGNGSEQGRGPTVFFF